MAWVILNMFRQKLNFLSHCSLPYSKPPKWAHANTDKHKHRQNKGLWKRHKCRFTQEKNTIFSKLKWRTVNMFWFSLFFCIFLSCCWSTCLGFASYAQKRTCVLFFYFLLSFKSKNLSKKDKFVLSGCNPNLKKSFQQKKW